MASNEWLVRKLHEQDKKIEALSRGGTGVGHTSIAPGENLTVISDNGEVVLGAGGVEHVDGPTPATPSAPTLKLGFGTIETTWDGSFAEGEDEDGVPLVAPVDFDVVEVHCSTDPEEEEWGEDTMRGQIKAREGGTITVGGFDVDDEVFVCLIALAKTGKRSAPSATASLVIEGLDFSALFNELDAANATIKNAGEVLVTEQGTLDEKLTEVDGTLNDLGQDLQAVEDAQAQLNTDLTDVMTSVDGKNTITWDPSAPSAVSNPGKAVGDLWYRTSGNNIIGFWKWDGTDWVTQLLDVTTIPLIDIGAGTFGSLSGSRLDVASVTADKVLIAGSDNLVVNPKFENDAAGWSYNYAGGNTDNFGPMEGVGRSGGAGLTATGPSGDWYAVSQEVPVEPGEYLMTVWVKSSVDIAPGVEFMLTTIRPLLVNGSQPWMTSPAADRNVGLTAGVWKKIQSVFTVPADGLSTIFRVGSRSGLTSGTLVMSDISVVRRSGATLIEDGGITTPKLAADVLEVKNLKATSGQLDEAVINKLFSDVVVAKTAVAEQFIGENAILTGAVTAPKITASEELWAKIAQFVKIRAEHIEADAIDGMVITGATIRSAATGARVQLSASGIESFNDTNERTFYAEASTGNVYMVGSFYSNNQGQPRVEIDNDDWANIPVIDDTGTTQYVNGAGIRIGSDATYGFSIYHGATSAGGNVVQDATIKGPLGNSMIGLAENGAIYLKGLTQNGQSSIMGAGNMRGQGAIGDTYMGTYDNGVLAAVVRTYRTGVAHLQSRDASNSIAASVSTSRIDGATMKTPASRVSVEPSGSVNVTVDYASGGRFRVDSVWGVTSSTGSQVRVNNDGTMFRDGSSERYKQDISDAPVMTDILNITPRVWRERSAVEASERLTEFRESIGIGPVPRELGDAAQRVPWHFGAVAEELDALGLKQFVQYDEYGRPDGIDYDRIGVALIPIVRDLRTRTEELERQLNE